MSKVAEGAAHEIEKLKGELMAERLENDRLRARMKDHEMFRHQHRDCARMGIALHQIGLLVKRTQDAPKT